MKYFLVAIICLWAIPAEGLDSVQISEATGDLVYAFHDGRTPHNVICIWDNLDYPSTSFHVSNEDGLLDGNPNVNCLDSFCEWLVHCDSDSLVFRGRWNEYIDDSYYGHGTAYAATLTCQATVLSDTKLSAIRIIDFEAELFEDTHSIQLVREDGSTEYILEDGMGADEFESIIAPGSYQLLLTISAYYMNNHNGVVTDIPPYSGYVKMWWGDPEPSLEAATSWGTIKSLYR